MSAQVTVLVGPARCGKTHQLLELYRGILRQPAGHGLGRLLWLAPTSRTAAAAREQLLTRDLTACLDPGVTTFDFLARRLLAALPRPPRSVTAAQRRELLRHVIRDAGFRKQLTVLGTAAGRSSFVDLLANHFDELMHRGIESANFVKLTPSDRHRARHQELGQLYRDYEQLLRAHNLVDIESSHRAARDVLANDDVSALQQLELVVVDGFADFTYTQHEILQQLARRCNRLMISLPGDQTGRSDLFAKSQATLAALEKFHPKLEVPQLDCRTTAWPALDHIAHSIFRHPRDIPVPSKETEATLNRIEIHAAAGAQDEIVQLARGVKERLIADGARVRPDEIMVVFRHLAEVAPRVRAVFSEFGIPFSLEARAPLLGAGVIRTLLALLRCDSQDWPFRLVVAVVTNNMLTTIDRSARGLTDWLIRDLQIASGRQKLLDRVDALLPLPVGKGRGEGLPTSSQPTHREHRTLAAAAAKPVLKALADALDELPQSATPSEWIAALARLGERLGITPLKPALAIADGARDDELARENRIAWACVTEHFTAIERLAGWMNEPPPQLSREALLKLLVDVAQHESLPHGHDEIGRVRILSAATARTVDAKHVFLAKMSEQSFPSAEGTSRLYSESEYRAFAQVVHPVRGAKKAPVVTRPQEEMLLFYEVLTRAADRLTISYPALDEKAQDLPPSPYVTELERAAKSQIRLQALAPRPLPLPTGATPLSPSDWRIEAVHRALGPEGDVNLLAGLFREPAMNGVANSMDAALRMNAERANRDKFSAAEGLLESAAVRKRLVERFGPEHLWSPSQFEAYARCPYNFYLENVLRLEPLGELTLETDYRRRGSLWHRVLARFHRELQASGRAGLPSQHDPDLFAVELLRVLNDEVAESAGTGIEAALVDLDRMHIARWIESYFGEHSKYDSTWTALNVAPAPAYFEYRFGPPRHGENELEDPRSTSEPFLLDLGQEQIRVTGRIDRIDVGQHDGRTVFTVIDYKSGKRPSLNDDKIASGERLQPALYVMAAQALLFGGDKSTPLWAGYWSMANGVNTTARFSMRMTEDNANPSEQWQSNQTAVIDRIREIVAGIRGGDFPVTSRDDNCTAYCPFATVCRVTQIRSLDKQWAPAD